MQVIARAAPQGALAASPGGAEETRYGDERKRCNRMADETQKLDCISKANDAVQAEIGGAEPGSYYSCLAYSTVY